MFQKCTSKKTQHFSVTKINYLILFVKEIAIYTENRMRNNKKYRVTDPQSRSSLSLHELGESPVPASSIIVFISIIFLVYLYLVFRKVNIYMPVLEGGYVPFFADECLVR
jgi:hypothetical protein